MPERRAFLNGLICQRSVKDSSMEKRIEPLLPKGSNAGKVRGAQVRYVLAEIRESHGLEV